MAKIHPTAIVDTSAELADSVEVGAFAVIENDVTIGEGSVIRPHAFVHKYTHMGEGNYVDSYASIGSDPQDLKFKPQTLSYLSIGNGNTFREGVTISRATDEGEKTIIGNNILCMANSHIGHNSIILDNAILVNGSLIAGHCTIGKGAITPANGSIHQFCWVGENAMFQGGSEVSMHVPPFVTVAGANNVVSLNSIGLKRRADLTTQDRQQIKEAFKIAYQSNLSLKEMIAEMDQRSEWGAPAKVFRDFIHQVGDASVPFNRGLCPHLSRSEQRHK